MLPANAERHLKLLLGLPGHQTVVSPLIAVQMSRGELTTASKKRAAGNYLLGDEPGPESTDGPQVAVHAVLGESSRFWPDKGVFLPGLYLLEVEDELPDLPDTDTADVGGKSVYS